MSTTTEMCPMCGEIYQGTGTLAHYCKGGSVLVVRGDIGRNVEVRDAEPVGWYEIQPYEVSYETSETAKRLIDEMAAVSEPTQTNLGTHRTIARRDLLIPKYRTQEAACRQSNRNGGNGAWTPKKERNRKGRR